MYSHIIYLAICCDFFFCVVVFFVCFNWATSRALMFVYSPTRYLNTPSKWARYAVCICVFFIRLLFMCIASRLRVDSDDEKIDRKKNDKIIECHRAKTIMFMINEVFFALSRSKIPDYHLHRRIWLTRNPSTTNSRSNHNYLLIFFVFFSDFFRLWKIQIKRWSTHVLLLQVKRHTYSRLYGWIVDNFLWS